MTRGGANRPLVADDRWYVRIVVLGSLAVWSVERIVVTPRIGVRCTTDIGGLHERVHPPEVLPVPVGLVVVLRGPRVPAEVRPDVPCDRSEPHRLKVGVVPGDALVRGTVPVGRHAEPGHT